MKKQYQWMPADSGDWFEIDPAFVLDEEETERELNRVLGGPKRQTEGAKVRWREVGPWQEYKLPVDPAEVLKKVKAYFKHNPSSTFAASEVLHVLQELEVGKERL